MVMLPETLHPCGSSECGKYCDVESWALLTQGGAGTNAGHADAMYDTSIYWEKGPGKHHITVPNMARYSNRAHALHGILPGFVVSRQQRDLNSMITNTP